MPGGGIDPMHPPVPIPAASAASLQREIDVCRQIALTATPAFEVQCRELLFISAKVVRYTLTSCACQQILPL